MAVFIKTLKMTKCVDIYTNYEQTVVKFYTEGKQKTTKIINFVQRTYQELDGRETRSAREIPSVTIPGNNPPTNNQFPTGALVEIHSSFEDAYTSICKFKEMAEKIRSGEISVQDDQVHEQFFGHAQDIIQYTLQGLCEEIALYLVWTNSSPWETSTRDSDDSQIWYNKLPGGLQDVGEFIDNVVSLPFAVANLPMNWIKQKCWEWSPDQLYPGRTNGDDLKIIGGWIEKAEKLIQEENLGPFPDYQPENGLPINPGPTIIDPIVDPDNPPINPDLENLPGTKN